MKKLIFFLIAILLAGAVSAQSSNTFKYVINAKGGITNTKKALAADKIDSTKVSGGYYYNYQGADALTPYIPSTGQLDLATVFTKQSDTTFTINGFGFGGGARPASDSTLAIKGMWLGDFRNGNDTLIIRGVNGVVAASKNAPTISIQLYYSDTLFAVVPDSVFSAPVAITSTTIGTSNTTFNGTKNFIPPRKWIYAKVSQSLGLGTKPKFLTLSFPYSIINRTY